MKPYTKDIKLRPGMILKTERQVRDPAATVITSFILVGDVNELGGVCDDCMDNRKIVEYDDSFIEIYLTRVEWLKPVKSSNEVVDQQ